MCCLVVKRGLKSKDQRVKEENQDMLETQMWEILEDNRNRNHCVDLDSLHSA